jgi:hypothetical protein
MAYVVVPIDFFEKDTRMRKPIFRFGGRSAALPIRLRCLAAQTDWLLYGMIRDAWKLIDDLRFKQLSRDHEDNLVDQLFGPTAKCRDVFNSLFPHWVHKLGGNCD